MCRNSTYSTILNMGLSPRTSNVDQTPVTYRPGAGGLLPVVAELEGDAEVVAAQEANDILQLVFRSRRDAQLIPLDARLHLLQLLVFEELDDVARGVAGNPLLQRDDASNARAARRFNLA